MLQIQQLSALSWKKKLSVVFILLYWTSCEGILGAFLNM